MMRHTAALALAICVISCHAAFASPSSRDPAKVPAGSYVLDQRHASLVVKAPYLGGLSHYTMRFTKLDGSFSYDPANWQGAKVTITVDPKSVDTEGGIFDRIVSGYFEPDKYPVIQFISSALTSDAKGRGQLTGDLTLHGVTRPVTLAVEFNGVRPGPMGAPPRLGFSGTGAVRRSEFGMTGGRPWTGDVIHLLFAVEFVKK